MSEYYQEQALEKHLPLAIRGLEEKLDRYKSIVKRLEKQIAAGQVSGLGPALTQNLAAYNKGIESVSEELRVWQTAATSPGRTRKAVAANTLAAAVGVTGGKSEAFTMSPILYMDLARGGHLEDERMPKTHTGLLIYIDHTLVEDHVVAWDGNDGQEVYVPPVELPWEQLKIYTTLRQAGKDFEEAIHLAKAIEQTDMRATPEPLPNPTETPTRLRVKPRHGHSR